MIDNQEHIPRVAKIPRAVALLFRDAHRSRVEADAVLNALQAYGKQLFMDEWMNQLEHDEDKTQALDEAAAAFDRILPDG